MPLANQGEAKEWTGAIAGRLLRKESLVLSRRIHICPSFEI